MMSKHIGVFERLFKNLRISLRAPKQPVKLVGNDHLGNKYYEKDTSKYVDDYVHETGQT